jgi:hypothetical protein
MRLAIGRVYARLGLSLALFYLEGALECVEDAQEALQPRYSAKPS